MNIVVQREPKALPVITTNGVCILSGSFQGLYLPVAECLEVDKLLAYVGAQPHGAQVVVVDTQDKQSPLFDWIKTCGFDQPNDNLGFPILIDIGGIKPVRRVPENRLINAPRIGFKKYFESVGAGHLFKTHLPIKGAISN